MGLHDIHHLPESRKSDAQIICWQNPPIPYQETYSPPPITVRVGGEVRIYQDFDNGDPVFPQRRVPAVAASGGTSTGENMENTQQYFSGRMVGGRIVSDDNPFTSEERAARFAQLTNLPNTTSGEGTTRLGGGEGNCIVLDGDEDEDKEAAQFPRNPLAAAWERDMAQIGPLAPFPITFSIAAAAAAGERGAAQSGPFAQFPSHHHHHRGDDAEKGAAQTQTAYPPATAADAAWEKGGAQLAQFGNDENRRGDDGERKWIAEVPQLTDAEEKARARLVERLRQGSIPRTMTRTRTCIVLDDSDDEKEKGEEDVKFLGDNKVSQPQSQGQPSTPRRDTLRPFANFQGLHSSSQSGTPFTFSSPSSQPQTPSSQKRKLASLDAAATPSRPPPQQRQARSAQSLSRSEWTFGEPASNWRSSFTGFIPSADEALSPFSSTPTTPAPVFAQPGRGDSIMSGSINRREGYEVVMKVDGGEVIPVVRNGEAIAPASGGKLGFGGEVVGAVKERLFSTPKKKEGGSEVVVTAKEQITPTPKGNNGVKFSIGSEVVVATKDQSTPTLTSKSTAINKGITTNKSTSTNKKSGVNEDWEVLEVGPSRALTLPHRLSVPPNPVIDLEDYELLPTLTTTRSNTATIIGDSDSESDFDFEIIGSQSLQPTPTRRRSTVYPLRNPTIRHPLYSITSTTLPNLPSLTTSAFVELSDGDFLKITHLIRSVDTGAITLRGHRFQRTRDLNGLLAKKRNELCWVTEVDEDDERPASVQSLSEVPASSVVRVRKALITNMAFPNATFRDTPHPGGVENAENEGLLAVRWSYTTTWPSAKERINNENCFCERVLRHLGEGDALVGEGLRIRDDLAREQFRGPTVLGGSYIPAVRSGGKSTVKLGNNIAQDALFEADMVDLTDEYPTTQFQPTLSIAQAMQERMLKQIDLTTPELSLPPPEGTVKATNAASKKPVTKRVGGQMYTYGDAFCGAGGATRGAQTAGLKVLWGFDFNAHACETWRLNFPAATMYQMSAFDVCEIWAKEAKAGQPNRAQVCILHISPPCQFFSPAHTVAGKDDEMNTASLLACGRLLALVKPRIVTLEQTFGIGHAEFTRWFNALIHQFTDNGYSLRWKICDLEKWGLPQRRHRLIIIAACPGETLPPFPPYTHSRDPAVTGLRPYTSVNSILSSIPLGAPDHDLPSILAKPLHEAPWDGSSIAPRAITTHGGQNYHPGGKRGFTNREFAALQGFPGGHLFGERNVKKQIGNAVPPSVAAVLFGGVRAALEKADGVEREVVVVD